MRFKTMLLVCGITALTLGVGIYSTKVMYTAVSEKAINEVKVFPLTKGPISEKITAPINFVRTEKMNMVYPEYNLVKKVLVKKGDLVNKGDKII